ARTGDTAPSSTGPSSTPTGSTSPGRDPSWSGPGWRRRSSRPGPSGTRERSVPLGPVGTDPAEDPLPDHRRRLRGEVQVVVEELDVVDLLPVPVGAQRAVQVDQPDVLVPVRPVLDDAVDVPRVLELLDDL